MSTLTFLPLWQAIKPSNRLSIFISGSWLFSTLLFSVLNGMGILNLPNALFGIYFSWPIQILVTIGMVTGVVLASLVLGLVAKILFEQFYVYQARKAHQQQLNSTLNELERVVKDKKTSQPTDEHRRRFGPSLEQLKTVVKKNQAFEALEKKLEHCKLILRDFPEERFRKKIRTYLVKDHLQPFSLKNREAIWDCYISIDFNELMPEEKTWMIQAIKSMLIRREQQEESILDEKLADFLPIHHWHQIITKIRLEKIEQVLQRTGQASYSASIEALQKGIHDFDKMTIVELNALCNKPHIRGHLNIKSDRSTLLCLTLNQVRILTENSAYQALYERNKNKGQEIIGLCDTERYLPKYLEELITPYFNKITQEFCSVGDDGNASVPQVENTLDEAPTQASEEEKNIVEKKTKSMCEKPTTMEAWTKKVEENLSYGKLSLRWKGINDTDMELLAEAIKQNKSITTIDVSGNNISDDGVCALAEAIEQNKGITTIDLDYNQIGDKGAMALAQVAAKHPQITKIALSSNRIGDDGACALAEAIEQNKGITRIDLSYGYNPIGNKGAIALAKAAAKHPQITKIALGGNRIGDDGACALAEAIEQNKGITRIDLNCNQIGNNGACALAKAIGENKDMTTVQLGGDQISDVGVCALAVAIEQNKSITTVGLINIQISTKGAMALAKAIERNQNITRINLSYSQIGNEGMMAFLKLMKMNTTITTFSMCKAQLSETSKNTLKEIERLTEQNKQFNPKIKIFCKLFNEHLSFEHLEHKDSEKKLQESLRFLKRLFIEFKKTTHQEILREMLARDCLQGEAIKPIFAFLIREFELNNEMRTSLLIHFVCAEKNEKQVLKTLSKDDLFRYKAIFPLFEKANFKKIDPQDCLLMKHAMKALMENKKEPLGFGESLSDLGLPIQNFDQIITKERLVEAKKRLMEKYGNESGFSLTLAKEALTSMINCFAQLSIAQLNTHCDNPLIRESLDFSQETKCLLLTWSQVCNFVLKPEHRARYSTAYDANRLIGGPMPVVKESMNEAKRCTQMPHNE